ncbi:Integral inner nuclear membrane protein ima1 [Colletotrichum orbiculare MAFF 240422]|uniref:Integral inner nuclear membrane protein ima1 n=1 Tax=Colletotrichum orbiculare (strain 104-T / ATCC 96160 / CBS 514.97 / LARS 414 / MAFF 240422) TaxID=1213857 RepID=N4VH57_COLOR|nr:Integral inner nuclear membrane protein ima1 [Colletotrichum orbiculare MAFF 240422]
MANLRSRRFLNCFYCGKRSSIKYDGFIREFLCLHCDATNYLDEHGGITDPPVAKTTSTTAPTTYAIPRSQSPDFSSPSQSIFCATCLKNQHLFTSSLAQYLPDDPDHPEYEELERNMYKFRRRLEQRYPQICAECEPKVHAKLDQAGYTARTDHLRRMMDRSRKNRVVPKQTTPLDWSASFGRCLWLGGIVLQYLWHVASLAAVFSGQDEGPLRDPDVETTLIQRISLALTLLLPRPERLVYWSLWSNGLSVWWNPKFTQVFRGFSRHIMGIGQWYTFQGLILLTRFMAMKMSELRGGRSADGNAQLSLHSLLAVLMVAIYILANRSVRIDITPLFQASTTPVSSPPRPQVNHKKDDNKSMSNLLDDILAESTPRPGIPPSPPTSVESGTSALFQRELQHRRSNRNMRLGTPQPEQRASVQYSEEMDWSPTQDKQQSKHRAFSDFGPAKAPKQLFGQPAPGPNSSPFWYKVPPAPTTPAQRLRNPKPLLPKSAEKKSIFETSTVNTPKGDAATDAKSNLRDVAFAQPTFFAPSTTNPSDPRNSLADLLNTSFSLSQDDPEEHDSVEGGKLQSRDANAETATGPDSARTAGLRNNRLLDVFTLAILLLAWLHATSASYPYSRDVMLGAMGLSMVIAAHLTFDAIRDMRSESTLSWASITNLSLGIGELAVACHFALQIWGSRMSEATSGLQGASVIGVMLLHETWNAAC